MCEFGVEVMAMMSPWEIITELLLEEERPHLSLTLSLSCTDFRCKECLMN